MRCQTLCHARSLPASGWSCDQKRPFKTREEPIFLYASQGWVWNILTNRYQGWAYLGGHLLTTAYIASKLLKRMNEPRPKTGTDKPQQS